MIDHPSFLELDRVALGVDVASTTRTHLSSCERCRHHVEQLEQRDSPPTWVRDLARPRRPRRTWLFGGGFALAAAAAMVLLVVARRDPDPSFTTVKGGPSVAVHIKRGDAVFVWDGREPVSPGDHLRLEIAATGYHRVQVFAAGDVALYDAPIAASSGSVLLPTAWKVDAEPGAETLTIVLSDGDSHQPVWRTTLKLTKTTEEDPR
jgi:hypothetical protein